MAAVPVDFLAASKNATRLVQQPRAGAYGALRAWVLGKLQQITEECLSAEYRNPTAGTRALGRLGKAIDGFVARRDVTDQQDQCHESERVVGFEGGVGAGARGVGG